MRRLLPLLLLLLALPAAAGLFDKRPNPELGGQLNNSADFLPVREAFRLSLVQSTPQSLKLRFVAAEGYYLYRHRFQFRVEPTDLAGGAVQLPPGEAKHDQYFGDVEVYHGVLDIDVPLNNPYNLPINLQVTYQGCADKGLCYPPETERLDIGAPPSPAGPSSTEEGTWTWHALALFFLAGLGLTFTPCVLPMLPILSGVVLRGQVGGLRGLSLSLAYVLPMAACFALLGALMGVFGAELNLQARLQSPWVLVPFAAFFVVFALAMFGVFELRLPRLISEPLDRLAGNARGGSLWGAALLGVLSSLLVSPCVSAPLAGALLYIGASGDALGGGLKLFALGLGMGAPLVLFATGGGALLPKSGNWLLTVRNTFGVLLLAVAVWLLERVLPGPLALALWATLAAGSGYFLARRGRLRLGLGRHVSLLAAALLLSYAVSAAVGAVRGGSDPLRPWSGALATGEWVTLDSASELDSALARAKAAGQPLLLDWYADWCISCKVIEREVFGTEQIKAQLTGYRLIRFDITASTAEQRAVLDRYKLFGPPAVLLFDEKGDERSDLRVVGEIDAAAFSARLQKAADR
ncbi:protein-disulfide reductase DsbD [Pseudomonas sp. LS44]|uniref:protein-disulfide reductase DsbD n=1 Tax=Pseudomonas sp. LS44 TaxID=1357074 RepID=UPI00215B4897|nr:protein-disulfide reductase DsbD [Pseudomonas sp. LS44]UVE17230.1 protein-disulfide reductase DsbD [Pseudomonas sp. LS44]